MSANTRENWELKNFVVFLCGIRSTQLTHIAHHRECGIESVNTSYQQGSHWVCYFKDGMNRRIYFDSFGQVTPMEIQKYLKTRGEYETDNLTSEKMNGKYRKNLDCFYLPGVHKESIQLII